MRIILAMAIGLVFPMLAAPRRNRRPKAPTEAKNLLKPTNDPESWVFELNDAGKGEMKVDGDAIVFHTTETTGTDWHVQAYQPELDLKDDQAYVVKFQMKAAEPVEMLLVAGINEEDWHEIGLHENLNSTDEFKDYEFEFTAQNTAEKNNRLGFVLGIDKGVVSVKDLSLTEKESPQKPQ